MKEDTPQNPQITQFNLYEISKEADLQRQKAKCNHCQELGKIPGKVIDKREKIDKMIKMFLT